MKDVYQILSQARLPINDEYECQNAIALHLAKAGIVFKSEYKLSPQDRIDFLCEGGVGVEVKVKGSASVVARQLKRYEISPEIVKLVLVTRRNINPGLIDFKKPLQVVWISQGLL